VTEGWPKVLSEAMAFGAVPVAAAVGSIPRLLGDFECGAAVPAGDSAEMAAAIAAYCACPQRWAEESGRAAVAAGLFTYTRYLEAVKRLLAVAEHGTEAESRDLWGIRQFGS
jgi:glycosyltransferase involved in cell wall biosynthesis